MYNKIIPLGSNCGITFILQHLKIKKETSLFEWFRSGSLSSINKVVQHIHDHGINYNIVCKNVDYITFFGDRTQNAVKTSHYKIKNFKDIYIRRAQRFMDNIKNEQSLLFIRIDSEVSSPTKKTDIENFINIIKFSL